MRKFSLIEFSGNAPVFIWAVCEKSFHTWIVWGEDRDNAEANYLRAMCGRWPKKKPAYRVVVNRKMDSDGYLLPRAYGA